MPEMYLKSNVVIEPLYDRWYAWTHLISPPSAAMNVVNRHLKIMKSYIQAPHIHAAAVKNPKMLGGPFMDYNGQNRTEDIKQLVARTQDTQKHLVEFSEAIKETDNLLRDNAKGYSLEPLYEKIPDHLKGYVELFYDLNNNPSFRFFEALLYKSKYYNTSSQSIALWLTDNDKRPFALSTPKLDDDHVIHVDIPFADPLIDELSRMKRKAGSFTEIIQKMNIAEDKKVLFESLFTTEPPSHYSKYEGDNVRMRYFGHACILIETAGISILLDPLISYYGYKSDITHYSDQDLPETIDFVLITHNHQDHILFETLLPLRHRIKNIIVPKSPQGMLHDPNLKLILSTIGFKNVLEIDEMETLSFGNCQITGIPFTGEHADLNVRTKMCPLVRIKQFSALFAADSRVLEAKLYEHVKKEIGNIDVIFLGMECDGAPLSWLYGPLLTQEIARDKDVTRRLSGSNYEKGMHLVNIFEPREVYVYAMGQEPWLEFISSIKYTEDSNPIIASNKLIEECKSRGILGERLFGEKELMYSIN